MCRLYVWGLEWLCLCVCVERKWLAHVVKVRSSVLPVLFVCVSMCMWSWSQLLAWTGCSESPGGILGISDSRKSGHTLNLSLQHNPHNEGIQAPLHTLSCLASALTALCA